MATYIKGSESFLPDIKPFTPDYKFLSAVLQTRTDKYDANFKATNDLYNKVVYADLSREDTKERRDQYADLISPQIEKISGMDLSLAQNADAARSVFAPFYDDDLTVKDIVFTSQYRDEMAYADRLAESSNKEMNERYWETGRRGLQYRMDDFINGSADQALQASLPKYIEDADLYQLATDYLESMEPPLSVKIDHYGENADGTANTDWIITEKNGRLVTGQALQAVQNALLNNPKVQAAYQEDAFVKSRDFAAQGMQAGQFSSVEQGQNAWATEQINIINKLNDSEIEEASQKNDQAQRVNLYWQDYKNKNGIIPGSDMDEAMKEHESIAEATQKALDAKLNIKRIGAAPKKSIQGNLNKAYNMLMNYNIARDMKAAAVNYGARDQEYTMRVNEIALFEKKKKWDLVMERTRASNNMALQRLKNKNARDLAIEKGEIVDNSGNPNSLQNKLKRRGITFNDPNTFTAKTDKDGDVTSNVDVPAMNSERFIELDNKVFERQVDAILDMKKTLYPDGNTPARNQTYKFEYEGAIIEGTVESIKKKLLETVKTEGDEGGPTEYVNRGLVASLYEKESELFLNNPEVTKNINPNATADPNIRGQYDDLYDRIAGPNNSINTQIAGLQAAYGKVNELTFNAGELTYKALHDINSGYAGGYSKDASDLQKAGWPSIFDENGVLLNKDEYRKLVVAGIEKGEITNPNISGWDSGTNNKDYKAFRTYSRSEMDNLYGYDRNNAYAQEVRKKYRSLIGGVNEVQMAAVNNDLNAYYDMQYNALNNALTGKKGNIPTASLNTVLEGGDYNVGDLMMNPSYKYSVNPLTPNIEAETEVGNFLDQMDHLNTTGKGYGIVAGDIDGLDSDELLSQQAVAQKVHNLYMEDLQSWYNNPKRSNADKTAPIATYTYNPVYGRSEDGRKTTAAAQWLYSPEWLASKVVGGSDVSDQYGALTTDDIKLLSDAGQNGESGITIIYDQKDDINPNSNENFYVSKINSAILQNGKGYAEYSLPDGIGNTVDFRVVKDGSLDYRLNYTLQTYVPYNPTTESGGSYITETQTQPIDMSYGIRKLDEQVFNFYDWAKSRREENRLAHKRDQEQYGIK